MEGTGSARRTILICLLLTALTVGAYWPVFRNDFISLDDRQYVLENPHVVSGAIWENVKWALTSRYASNWHPATWWSHMVDVQLFGLKPLGHHSTSLLLHLINTSLLFLLLKRMTGWELRSAVVAALFGLHPVHVESVAWVAERKDVLSTFFFLLTLHAYTAMATERGVRVGATSEATGRKKRIIGWYVLALVFFALGLMSKPMLVTLPFVLLLLDYWPLQRLTISGTAQAQKKWMGLILEKLPFFALSIGSSILTFLAQDKGHSVSKVTDLSIESRLANAVVSYVKYLGKTIWPVDLAVFYPHANAGTNYEFPLWEVGGAALILIGASLLAIWQLRRAPWFGIGWFWFLGTLVPVIGIVQVGGQAMADRYMYIPSIGLFICAAWGVSEGVKRWGSVVVNGLAAAVIVACLAATHVNAKYWRNTTTLFEHAIAATGKNAIAQYILGVQEGEKGNLDAARRRFIAAVDADPSLADAHSSLGFLLFKENKLEEAMQEYQLALRVRPWHPLAHNGLGAVYWRQGRSDEAIEQYTEAIRSKPNFPEAHFNLGVALSKAERDEEAAAHLREAARLKPEDLATMTALIQTLVKLRKFSEAQGDLEGAKRFYPTNAEIELNLGGLYEMDGKPGPAIEHYKEAVRLAPDSPETQDKMGESLLRDGKAAEAEQHLLEAVRLSPDDFQIMTSLGKSYVAQGKHDRAEDIFRKALTLNSTNAEAHVTLANALMIAGKTNEAAMSFGEAQRLDPNLAEQKIREAKELTDRGEVNGAIAQLSIAASIQPTNATAHANLGLLLAQTGKVEEAIPHFEQAVRLRPDAEAYHNLGLAHLIRGQGKEAVANYEQALKLRPDWPVAINDLAWILATHSSAEVRNGPEAVRLAERVCELSGGKEARYWGSLDAAYAEVGRFEDAVKTASKTMELASKAGEKELAEAAANRLALYREHKPYRQ